MALRVSGSEVPRVWLGLLSKPWPGIYSFEEQVLSSQPFNIPCLCLSMPEGRSYTREHVMELHFPANETICHHLMEAVFAFGVEPAEPGEFTRRAYVNGRLGLNEAQSVAALIAARDERQRHQAVQMMSGATGDVMKSLKESIFLLRRNLEAVIDFPEEPDIEEGFFRWGKDLSLLETQLEEWRQSIGRSSASDVAIKVLLLGPANAGKSSLIRALIPGSQPVVSHHPGTTLDLIPYAISTKAGPVHLYDSPGLKEHESELDRLSLGRLFDRLASFDAVIKLATQEQWSDVEWPELPEATSCLEVVSKVDQCFAASEQIENRLALSSLRGDGVADLMETMERWGSELANQKTAPMDALKKRLLSLCQGRMEHLRLLLLNDAPEEELAAYELDELLDEIDGLSGEEGGSEALLDGIFRDFCIGK